MQGYHQLEKAITTLKYEIVIRNEYQDSPRRIYLGLLLRLINIPHVICNRFKKTNINISKEKCLGSVFSFDVAEEHVLVIIVFVNIFLILTLSRFCCVIVDVVIVFYAVVS